MEEQIQENNVSEQQTQNSKKKKLIYISPEINPIIEEVAKESKNIDIIQRFINTYNFSDLLQNSLKSLNNIDFLVIDVYAIKDQSSDKEILKGIGQIKGLYELRIIFMAQGYSKGNTLLAGLFQKGVLNIITANSDIGFKEEFKETISPKGIPYSAASKYEIESMNVGMVNNDKSIIKQNYIKVKQDITVGVIGITPHIGTTTCAINVTNFLNKLTNVKACLIENNNHNDFISIYKRSENKEDIVLLQDIGKIEYKGMDFYYKPEQIGNIRKEKYDFYVYDFGSYKELIDSEISSFLNKDIKIIVASDCLWEEKNLIDFIIKLQINPEDETIYYNFNFVAEENREKINKLLADCKNNIYFTEYQPDPFILKNSPFFEKIFKRYFQNFEFETENKKKKFLNFHKPKKVKN